MGSYADARRTLAGIFPGDRLPDGDDRYGHERHIDERGYRRPGWGPSR